MSERFGPFVLRRLLGRGGMAEAFLASNERDPSEVFVLKRIRPDHADRAEYQHRFVLEAQVVSRALDEHLVRFREFGRVGECYYLTMDQVRGHSLHRVFEPIFTSRKLPPLAVSAHLGLGLFRGLGALHRVKDEAGAPRPMIHRDVTPKNVIVSEAGEAVLIDFGIAKDMYGPSITVPGQWIGTARYMAPEHRRGEFIDARADVFSASVICFELFTGEHPWPPETSLRELLKTSFDAPEISRDVRERGALGRPRGACYEASRCDPDERWPDAGAAAAAL
ncbi:MAG: serine/threonine protein kinase, partial [Myxococcales bacterium]|nr:serine/threonine protein kinase [Myxococcales bacterium]